jgi:hypothetical protein
MRLRLSRDRIISSRIILLRSSNTTRDRINSRVRITDLRVTMTTDLKDTRNTAHRRGSLTKSTGRSKRDTDRTSTDLSSISNTKSTALINILRRRRVSLVVTSRIRVTSKTKDINKTKGTDRTKDMDKARAMETTLATKKDIDAMHSGS